MTSPKEWDQKVDMTWREYFNPPYMLPHIGIVKLARRMEQELGKEKAHHIVKEVAAELAYEYAKEKTKGIKVESMEDFPKAMDLIQGEIMKIGSLDGACLWAETWKDLDAMDIGYLWCCQSDAAIMRGISPNLKFTQGETLMTGGSFCDNNISWEDD